MAMNKWDALLQKGSRIPAIGSSDSHMPPTGKGGSPIGSPVTFVGTANLTQAAILSAIRKGHVFVSEKPDQLISITFGKTGIGDEIRTKKAEKLKLLVTTQNYPEGSILKLISDGKTLRESPIGKNHSEAVEFDVQKSTYLRAEVRDGKNKMLAFTDPIFIVTK